jgi:hypothetical protein
MHTSWDQHVWFPYQTRIGINPMKHHNMGFLVGHASATSQWADHAGLRYAKKKKKLDFYVELDADMMEIRPRSGGWWSKLLAHNTIVTKAFEYKLQDQPTLIGIVRCLVFQFQWHALHCTDSDLAERMTGFQTTTKITTGRRGHHIPNTVFRSNETIKESNVQSRTPERRYHRLLIVEERGLGLSVCTQ